MAARENQGLQIALIIFVVLTIALIVSTFMFFSKYDEERNKIAEKVKAAEAATTRAIEAEDQAKEIKTVLGVASGDNVKAIQETKKKDFAAMGGGLADDKQNYRALAQQLTKLLADKEADLIAAQEREAQLKQKIDLEETTSTGEIKTYKDTVDKTSEDYQGERAKLKQEIDVMLVSKDDLQKKTDAMRKRFDDDSKKLQGEIDGLNTEIAKLVVQRNKFKEKEDSIIAARELVDGNITWVNQGEKLVWLDLGSEDGLSQLVTFEVVGADEPNPADAISKGSIEVIRINDRHLAEARIIDSNPRDPIVPGDKLFSAAWAAGRAEHFAIMKFIDVDGDGLSDRDLIRRLIVRSGGLVDAEVTEKGMQGKVTVDTKYLILGVDPKSPTPEELKGFGQMTSQAESYGVKSIGVNKFLDMVGHRPGTRTVALDGKARSEDFKPRVPEVVKKSIGKTIDYTPLRAKPKTTQY